jgi:hypothetical protein
MKNQKTVLLAVISAVALPFMTVGCDREVSHTESTKVSSDGTVKKQEKIVTEHSDGTVTKTESKQTSTPDKP